MQAGHSQLITIKEQLIPNMIGSQDISNSFTYRARQGFIGIEMWPGNDTGVYLQGHLVIPNPWGDVFTNGTTTTTTTDTTAKGGGDDLCGIQCGGNQVLSCDCYYANGMVQTVAGGDCPATTPVTIQIGDTTIVFGVPLESKKCRCVDAVAI